MSDSTEVTIEISKQSSLGLYRDWSRVEFPSIENPDSLNIIVHSPIDKSHYPKLYQYASNFKRVTLTVGKCVEREYDLSVIEALPSLTNFRLLAGTFTDFSQFKYIPDDIEKFEIQYTEGRKPSLSFLERFKKLKSLSLEYQKKDIDVVADLRYLESLSIRYIAIPDLSIIANSKSLRNLYIGLGGTRDLSHVPSVKNLERLELWRISKLSNVDWIADSTNLRHLTLDQIKNVKRVSSLKKLTKLQSLVLDRMNGLADLQWSADAPNLKHLSVKGVDHMEPELFQPFVGHSKLKTANIYIGRKWTDPVRELLQLPEQTYKYVLV